MSGLPVDSMLDLVSRKSRNMLIPYYLMASYLYYHRDVSMLSDDRYDRLCKELDAEWDSLTHDHKQYIDRSLLAAGTGYALPVDLYPLRIIYAACSIAKIVAPPPRPVPVARVRTRSRA